MSRICASFCESLYTRFSSLVEQTIPRTVRYAVCRNGPHKENNRASLGRPTSLTRKVRVIQACVHISHNDSNSLGLPSSTASVVLVLGGTASTCRMFGRPNNSDAIICMWASNAATPPGCCSITLNIRSLSAALWHSHSWALKFRHAWWTSSRSLSFAPIVSTAGATRASSSSSMHVYTNSSTQHHKRLVYVLPLVINKRSHPATKIGKHWRSTEIFAWSMQNLSTQSVGDRW